MAAAYQLHRLLATGGMAEVYVGTALGADGFERPVAIKRLLPHLARDARIARMFAAEARLASFLHHQNIVQTLDVGRNGDELYLVMELVDGWDLGVLMGLARTAANPFPAHLAAFVAQQVVAALTHAYRHVHQGRQIIAAHRDVSPSNVMVTVEGEVKVADFGIARVDAGAAATEPGSFKGKYAYSAPEVLEGGKATHLSDQFALGLLLFEMLAGEHPFGHHADVLAYVDAIRRAPTPPLPSAPAALAGIVARMLSKSASDRFRTPEAAGEALGDFLARTGQAAGTLALARYVASLNPPPRAAQADRHDTALALRPAMDLRPVAIDGGSAVAEEDFVADGPQLAADGRLVAVPLAAQIGPPRVQAPAARPGALPTGVRELPAPATPVGGSEGLELDTAERFPAAPPPEPPPPAPSPWPRRLVAGAAILAIAGGLAVAGMKWGSGWAEEVRRMARGGRPRPAAAAVVRFESEPSGARVIVGRDVLGETPLVVDNDFPDGPIPVRLEKAGYRPWTGSFQGGRPAAVTAVMRR